MSETVMLGRGRNIERISRKEWEAHLSQVPERHGRLLQFMSRDHHRVRYFAVSELPRVGEPLEPELISGELSLPLDRVQSILDDLEKNLFFLVRNEDGSVSWAYPVTVDRTPHHLIFGTGERLYGA
jgi:hypothetical protein